MIHLKQYIIYAWFRYDHNCSHNSFISVDREYSATLMIATKNDKKQLIKAINITSLFMYHLIKELFNIHRCICSLCKCKTDRV